MAHIEKCAQDLVTKRKLLLYELLMSEVKCLSQGHAGQRVHGSRGSEEPDPSSHNQRDQRNFHKSSEKVVK